LYAKTYPNAGLDSHIRGNDGKSSPNIKHNFYPHFIVGQQNAWRLGPIIRFAELKDYNKIPKIISTFADACATLPRHIEELSCVLPKT
jgi:hypothetical protein